MKKTTIAALLTALLAAGSTAVCAAPVGSGGWGMGGAYQRMYNPASVESVSGEVQSVNRMVPRRGMGAGVHLMVKTDKETVAVHLGPAWYLDRQDTRIEKGDTVEVQGSRVTLRGKPVIIAREVKKGDQTLKLRDENGVPVWAGWRK